MAGPSFTARGVAQVRASIDRATTSPADSEAADELAGDLRTGLPLGMGRTLRSYLTARTRYFDDIVLTALRAPAQIVILGAGYDDRAIRFRSSTATFIEVDHPDTQADKLRRLQRLGIRTDGVAFRPVDLEDPDLSLGLDDILDAVPPTTIVCEALLPYLTPGAADRVLSALTTLPGSKRTIAIEVPVAPRSLSGRVAMRILQVGTRVTREPLRTICADAHDAEHLLTSTGWTIASHSTGSELDMPRATAEVSYITATS